MQMSKTRILIVDDDEHICRAWRRDLQRHGFVVEVAHVLADARTALRAGRFDVVLLDLFLEHERGLDLFDVIKGLTPRPAVVVVSGNINAEAAVEAIDCDAATVPKPVTVPELLRAIEKMTKGRGPIIAPLPAAARRARLSARELEAVRAAASGLTIKQTAVMMQCRPGTVAGYRRRAFKKTGAHNQAHLVTLVL
jgi:DNA-binding NarL/FixJ family response regulator